MRCSYGLQIYGDINNIVNYTGFLCETRGSHTIENRIKRYYTTTTKTKIK